jgi:hypothetical protein
MQKVKQIIYIVILILGISYILSIAPQSYVLAFAESKIRNYTKNVDVQEGDFIFQHLPGQFMNMIADMTNSKYSHCGIIVKKPSGFYVLEAIGPVKETPLNRWISYGVGRKFTIVRLKSQYRKDIPSIIQQGDKFLNRPYDIQYEWDDQKIYCSELIYKAVFNATGIHLAEFVRLGDMKWQPYEKIIREIADGKLPVERKMITPESLVLSDRVDVVYIAP